MMTTQQEIIIKFYSYHKNYYKLIGIDLSRQTKTSFLQQINFTRRSQDNGAIMFFIAEKEQKTILHFSLDSFIVTV